MLSTATPTGCVSWAWEAGPPSPAKPGAPVPATVLIVPSMPTLRTRLLSGSAT